MNYDRHIQWHNVRKEHCPYCDMAAASDKITVALHRLTKIPDSDDVIQVLGEALVDLTIVEPFQGED